MKVSYHPEVKADLRGPYDYYCNIDPELGLGFIAEYRKALALVKREPLVMGTFYKNDQSHVVQTLQGLCSNLRSA